MTRLELSVLLAGRSRPVASSACSGSGDVLQKAADGRVRKRSGAIRCWSPPQTKRFRCSKLPSAVERESLAHPAPPASPRYSPTSPIRAEARDRGRSVVDMTRVEADEESTDSDPEGPSIPASSPALPRRPGYYHPTVLLAEAERRGRPISELI